MPWADISDAAIITAEMADEILTELEVRHVESLHSQRQAADRLLRAAVELGRADLRRRALLVTADATIREGEAVVGSGLARTVLAEAEVANDEFALARAHYLLAWVSQAVGDMSGAQINGIRSVELLPQSTPRGIVMDHLTILAIAHNPAPEAIGYFDEALAIARECDDPLRTILIHNNIAYAALERGHIPLAQQHVAQMLAESERSHIPLSGAHLDTAARVYNEDGRYDDAIAILQPVAQAMDADEADLADLIDTQANAFPIGLLTLARAYRGNDDIDTARRLLDRAAAIAERDGLQGLAAQIGLEQARLHAAEGDFQRAYYEYVEFHEATLALQSEDQAARARIVQASFDADRNRQQAEHFRELAMRDALTGLNNRRYMDELLERSITEAAQRRGPLSLAIVDADFFKRINDEFSHDVGDDVLRTLATVLLHAKPTGSTLCRLGGEEFVVVMPTASSGEAVQGCEAMRAAVERHDWSPMTAPLSLTVSIGVMTAPEGQATASALLSAADRHLYAAKRSGRNAVVASAR